MESELPVKDKSQVFLWVFGAKSRTSNSREIKWGMVEEFMQPIEVKYFSFQIFNDETKLVQKFG